MTRSDADIVRANSEAFSRRDVDTMMELFAEDALVRDRRAVGWGDYNGRDAVRSYYQGLFDNAAELDENIEVVSDEDGVVVASCHTRARLAGDPDAADIAFDYALKV